MKSIAILSAVLLGLVPSISADGAPGTANDGRVHAGLKVAKPKDVKMPRLNKRQVVNGTDCIAPAGALFSKAFNFGKCTKDADCQRDSAGHSNMPFTNENSDVDAEINDGKGYCNLADGTPYCCAVTMTGLSHDDLIEYGRDLVSKWKGGSFFAVINACYTDDGGIWFDMLGHHAAPQPQDIDPRIIFRDDGHGGNAPWVCKPPFSGWP